MLQWLSSYSSLKIKVHTIQVVKFEFFLILAYILRPFYVTLLHVKSFI